MLRLVLEHLEEVIAYWYQLYALHFGDRRSLSEPEFRDLFYNALSRNTKDLLEGDIDRYSIDTLRTGELLCERNVPFAEIVASLHLYEESAYTVPTENSESGEKSRVLRRGGRMSPACISSSDPLSLGFYADSVVGRLWS